MQNHNRSRWEREDVERKTQWAVSRMQEGAKIALARLMDPDKKKRLEESYCVVCYYEGPTLAGQAMTDVNCRLCDTILHFSSTDTHELCQACAIKNKLCKDCGASVNLKVLRKFPFEK